MKPPASDFMYIKLDRKVLYLVIPPHGQKFFPQNILGSKLKYFDMSSTILLWTADNLDPQGVISMP